jgi:hypothetical protein
MNTECTLFLATAYIPFPDREYQHIVSRGYSFVLNLIVNYLYNLA